MGILSVERMAEPGDASVTATLDWIRRVAQETGCSCSVIVHALVVSSGSAIKARKYLNDRILEWTELEDQSLLGLADDDSQCPTVEDILREHGRKATEARCLWLGADDSAAVGEKPEEHTPP